MLYCDMYKHCGPSLQVLLRTFWQEEGSRVDHVLTRWLSRRFNSWAHCNTGGHWVAAASSVGTFMQLWFMLHLISINISPIFFSVFVSSFPLQIAPWTVCVYVSFDKILTFKITDLCVFYDSKCYHHTWYVFCFCLTVLGFMVCHLCFFSPHKLLQISKSCIYRDLPSSELYRSRVNCNRKHCVY